MFFKKVALLCFTFIACNCFGSQENLEVISGLMGRGKTKGLISKALRAKKGGKTVLALFHHFELGRQQYKTEKGLWDYTGQHFPAMAVKDGNDILVQYNTWKKEGNKPDLVLLDEGQFFMNDESLIPAIKTISSDKTKVIVAGLTHTFVKEDFGPMPALKKMAHVVHELSRGKCVKCKTNTAAWMQRIIIEKGTEGTTKKRAKRTDPIILVGKEDSYERRCETCHIIPNCDQNCEGCKECIDT